LADHGAKDSLIRRRVVGGTIANYAGQIVSLGTGFFLTPFVLHHLGQTQYGLWILVGSVVAYGSLLDLGIWGALVKYVAEFRARGENEQTRRLIATALWVYVLLGLAVIAASALIAPIFPVMFNVPESERATGSWLVMIMGISIGLSIPCSAQAAVLRGLQRYDLVNVIASLGILSSAIATVAVLQFGGDVLGMALVSIPITIFVQIPAIVFVRIVAPDLRFGYGRPSLKMVRSVVGFSASLFMQQISARLQTKTDEIVIGGFLPISAVAPYAVARRLSDVAELLTDQFTKVLLPLVSQLDAESDSGRVREVYLAGSRIALGVSLPIAAVLLLLGRQLLNAWVGEGYADYDYLLVILTVATVAGSSQGPGATVLQATARHRPIAIVALVSSVANLVLSLILVRPFGLIGVAIGTLLPVSLESLGFVLPFAMRQLRVSPGELLRRVILPASLPVVPMTAALYVLRAAFALDSLFAVGLAAVAASAVYAAAYLSMPAAAPEQRLARALTSDGFARVKLLTSRRSYGLAVRPGTADVAAGDSRRRA